MTTITQAPERFETCAGLAMRTFTITPDTKYNTDGLFKISMVVDPLEPEAQAFKAKIDVAAAEALNAEVPEKQRRGWEPYLPYEPELNAATGEETGRIIFEFKRNAKIKLRRAGEIKDLTVAVFDSRNRQAWPAPPITDGSLVRVMAEFRPIKIATSRKAGVRIDFSCVKVLKLASWCPFSNEQIDGGWECQ